jgi:hypothetical protein
LDGKTAEKIEEAILKALEEDGLDIKNLVGLGTDGANVLIGHRSGVYARLKEKQPDLCLVQCVCHSLHKAAQYAIEKLPCNLEEMVRSIYGYFCQSSTRKARYETVSFIFISYKVMFTNSLLFQLYTQITGVLPRKLLKLHDVRWLSLHQCIDAILKQWDELFQFFGDESENGDHHQRYVARQAYSMMKDKKNKVRQP